MIRPLWDYKSITIAAGDDMAAALQTRRRERLGNDRHRVRNRHGATVIVAEATRVALTGRFRAASAGLKAPRYTVTAP